MDAAIDFSGSSAAIGSAYGRLCVGGVLVLAGSVLPGPRIEVSPETMVRQCLTITGVHNYEPRHLTRAVKFLERTLEAYPWRTLVADPVDLDAIALGADAGTRGQAARRHQALAPRSSATTSREQPRLFADTPRIPALQVAVLVHRRLITDRSVHNGV